MNARTAEFAILGALATYTQRSGAQLSQMTGLGSGTLYPALFSLERAGRIESEWADGPWPRRRRYRLVGKGDRA